MQASPKQHADDQQAVVLIRCEQTLIEALHACLNLSVTAGSTAGPHAHSALDCGLVEETHGVP